MPAAAHQDLGLEVSRATAVVGLGGLGVERPELSIKTVMKEPAKATPIQIFIGLDSAVTAKERVELALAEMDRTDAWSRSLIMLVSPTGTGYVNYVAIAAARLGSKSAYVTRLGDDIFAAELRALMNREAIVSITASGTIN